LSNKIFKLRRKILAGNRKKKREQNDTFWRKREREEERESRERERNGDRAERG
tara:strand:- start:435 stop:593 length:159 start_codon:yes stop_codon:yes gene_type:complete